MPATTRSHLHYHLLRFCAPVLALMLLLGTAACAPGVAPGTPGTPGATSPAAMQTQAALQPQPAPGIAVAPSPDPRVGLRAGIFDAGEAIWNMRALSFTPTPERFLGTGVNSDLAFRDNLVIQGNYLGFMIWDITDAQRPELLTLHVCPGSQNDVSVHGNLLFLSVEGTEGRLDCGTEPPADVVSAERLRGVRIFDIADPRNPRLLANVQTCRGSHTHTLVYDPNDRDHLYIYVSGVMPVRPAEELAGCARPAAGGERAEPLSHIEVIRVPLAAPQQAAVIAAPRILDGLAPPPRHGPAPDDIAAAAAARARGDFVFHFEMLGEDIILPAQFIRPMLDSIMRARGGTGAPMAADTVALTAHLDEMFGAFGADAISICHDITIFPARGLAGGACVGYGVLLDVRDPTRPRRLDAVADSNFVAWHSATFSNDGTKVVFTDEWGGGGSPKCRASDPKEWGANAIFTIENERLVFQSYYKLPAPQTAQENCVAHNGSLIPVPGRDIMVQGWYQGGISIFDFTDPARPFEIAYHDRGPLLEHEMAMAGSWSVYWYNGRIINSEIVRGLDIFELVPSASLTQNEIDAAKTARLDYLNVQNQPRYTWPASFALARAYVDQLERSNGLPAARIAALRRELLEAERSGAGARAQALARIATALDADAAAARDAAKVRTLVTAVRELAAAR